jgi:hypothetical protein
MGLRHRPRAEARSHLLPRWLAAWLPLGQLPGAGGLPRVRLLVRPRQLRLRRRHCSALKFDAQLSGGAQVTPGICRQELGLGLREIRWHRILPRAAGRGADLQRGISPERAVFHRVLPVICGRRP